MGERELPAVPCHSTLLKWFNERVSIDLYGFNVIESSYLLLNSAQITRLLRVQQLKFPIKKAYNNFDTFL